MKTKVKHLLGAVLSLLVLTLTTNAATGPCATNAATQVFDLGADWSDTQNPNGTWSYLWALDNSPLLNIDFPWGMLHDEQGPPAGITRITESSRIPGFLEAGDISAMPGSYGVIVRWTAPANGTITISGSLWEPGFCGPVCTLSRNGSLLSEHGMNGHTRSSPLTLSLLNIPVQAGDDVDLSIIPFGCDLGLTFTITLTSDSVDPVAAIEALAVTVVDLNLQNGIENSLDRKLDAALNALVDANFNNDGAACNSLAAFINAVEAQRGNKITDAQADQLIASAQQIQCMLNCGN